MESRGTGCGREAIGWCEGQVSGAEQCETCAEGGLTHQPAKDGAALLRVRAVQVCIHIHVKSRMRGVIESLVQAGPSQVSRAGPVVRSLWYHTSWILTPAHHCMERQ